MATMIGSPASFGTPAMTNWPASATWSTQETTVRMREPAPEEVRAGRRDRVCVVMICSLLRLLSPPVRSRRHDHDSSAKNFSPDSSGGLGGKPGQGLGPGAGPGLA